jgi:alkanesulfonate monooxygenase SsuD/methylene tetrahydromethanopterin reductase-like flavin-dependent oxidoreductase (luciferase family)
MLFGGTAPAAIQRMARWGEGSIGGWVPAPMAAPPCDAARDAWSRAGRDGSPRLVALASYALGDGEQGRKNVHDCYSTFGDFANLVASAVCDTPQDADAVRAILRKGVRVGNDLDGDHQVIGYKIGHVEEGIDLLSPAPGPEALVIAAQAKAQIPGAS